MKRFFSFVLTVILTVTLSACASQSETPVMNAKMAATQAAVSSSAAQRTYVNKKLGFSFRIPDSWESGNYNAVVTENTAKSGKKVSQGGTVNFLFQDDPENPLLTVQVLPKSQWDTANKSSDSSAPDFLGESGDFVYLFTLPQNSTYGVCAKADLYNSMVLPHDDIPTRLVILTNAAETLSVASASNTK